MISVCIFFFLLIRRPPTSPLFPYTTLFRSELALSLSSQLTDSITGHESLAHSLWNGTAIDRSLYQRDRKSTRLNSSHANISYAVFCLKKKIIREELASSMIYSSPTTMYRMA